MGTLAERSGVARSTISKLEGGSRQNAGSSTMKKLSDALGVPMAVLAGGESAAPPPVIYGAVAAVSVRRNVVSHAGGEHAWQDTGEQMFIPAGLARNRTVSAVEVIGECLEPEVESGDLVAYEITHREPQDGEMVLISTETGDVFVKRAYHDRSGLFLMANDGIRERPNGARIEGIVLFTTKAARRKPLDEMPEVKYHIEIPISAAG